MAWSASPVVESVELRHDLVEVEQLYATVDDLSGALLDFDEPQLLGALVAVVKALQKLMGELGPYLRWQFEGRCKDPPAPV